MEGFIVDLKTFLGLATPNQSCQDVINLKKKLSWFWVGTGDYINYGINRLNIVMLTCDSKQSWCCNFVFVFVLINHKRCHVCWKQGYSLRQFMTSINFIAWIVKISLDTACLHCLAFMLTETSLNVVHTYLSCNIDTVIIIMIWWRIKKTQKFHNCSNCL